MLHYHFENSLNFLCAVAVISLGVSKCICISEEEAGATWLPWEERKGIFSGNFSLCFPMERVIYAI